VYLRAKEAGKPQRKIASLAHEKVGVFQENDAVHTAKERRYVDQRFNEDTHV